MCNRLELHQEGESEFFDVLSKRSQTVLSSDSSGGVQSSFSFVCPNSVVFQLAEDVREMWEVSDNPVVHKIQDINATVFGETAAGISVKEIRRRDPSFSLP
ncbi:hypothetical protein POM88_010403 [Heracleum sosnowskyi]|uniref:Uncharacterized protein n=1 Tax=Heracleum sosnowskyi TaxID=360622 RepID=A0AAD8IVY3_9APIA|nr:hypothetical protein POM88_010403 [Heracleum sosnowskyi]